MPSDLAPLQERIGISFRDPNLLKEALTHSSFANESPEISPVDNERLEYLGDAVLQLVSAEYLFRSRPNSKEGEMTQARSSMVNTSALATMAESIGLESHMYLGKGVRRTGSSTSRALLANAFEALVGAVFLDAGYDAAFHFFLDCYRQAPDLTHQHNFKGQLQQLVQERFGQTPVYDSVSLNTPGNRREHTAVVYVDLQPLGRGHGFSKQEAEQAAARAAIANVLGMDSLPAPEPEAKPAARPARKSRPRTGAKKAAEPVASEPVSST